MHPMTDRPLSDAEYADLRGFQEAAWAGLPGLARDASPADIVATIGVVAPGLRELEHDDQVAASIAYGAVWGEQVHRVLGWDWALVSPAGPEDEEFALVSPGREYRIAPLYLLLPYATGAQAEDTSALLFNLLCAGQLPASAPNAYLELQ